MVVKNYYNVLNINKDSDEKEIKKAYRKLAMESHPDINPSENSEETFKEISEAYAVLSDSEKRRHYDRMGHMDTFESYRREGIFGGCMGRGMGRRCGRGGFNRRQFWSLKNEGRVESGRYVFNLPLSSVDALNGIEKNIHLKRGDSVNRFSVIIPQNSQDGDLIKIDGKTFNEDNSRYYLRVKIDE